VQRDYNNYEDETEAQLAREELSKKLLGISNVPRTAPVSAIKFQPIAAAATAAATTTSSSSAVEKETEVSNLVGLKLSIKLKNKGRWKKCVVLRVGANSKQAVVEWSSSSKNNATTTVVKLFGRGSSQWKKN